MKKTLPFLLLLSLLAGCSGFQLPDFTTLLTPQVETPADTATPQPTVTLIPTRDLFAISTSTPVTFTPTPSPIFSDTAPTFTTPTPVPLPTFSEQFINDMSRVTFFAENVGFRGILFSAATMYWGEGACPTRSIKMTVFVEDPERTDRVYMFLRLRDKANTLNVGEWSAGAEMIKVENGSFNYNIEPWNLRRYFHYRNAWIEYQFVSVNEKNEILGRTQLYDRNLSLARCGL